MLATARAALDEAERAAGEPVERIAAALSLGALRGARGNSGVILSQVVRGFASGLAGKVAWTPRDIASALTEASRTADASVARPVEGTILTVVRASAEAARAAAESDALLPGVVEAAVAAADRAVDETPSLLPVLRDAGVVDSGGHGFYRLLEGIAQQLPGVVGRAGAAGPRPERVPAGGKPVVLLRDAGDHAVDDAGDHAGAEGDWGEGYETIFLVEADARPLDLAAIRDRLNELGESVVVAGDEHEARAHVHSPLPEPVVAYAMTLGRVSRMTVERLDEPAFGEADGGSGSGSGASIALVRRERAVVRAFERDGSIVLVEGEPAIVAIAPGEGLAELMRRDFEVTSIVRPAATAKPSAGELLAAVEMAAASETIIVANDANVILAARQVAGLAPRPVAVVPSRNAAEGFAALLAYDPALGLDANVERMTRAAAGVRSFVVTTAIRDAVIDGREVRTGDTLAIDASDRLAGAAGGDGDPDDAVLEALGESGCFELVTLYAGEAAAPGEPERLAGRICAAFDGVEVEIIPGGQPFHRFLVAVE